MKKISAQLKKLPESAGVYQFFDEKGELHYIGKAKNLKRRVSSYFQKTAKSPKLAKLQEKTTDLKFIETENETEALILEANLIRENQPKYNVLLRDDKRYQYIRVSLQEDFPRIGTVRQVAQDGARYFGPKTSGSGIKETLNLLRKIFAYRNCKMEIKWQGEGKVEIKKPDRRIPCLDFHIHRCPGCCKGLIDPTEYRARIEAICDFLAGDQSKLLRDLKTEMMRLAGLQKFEKAGRIRDQIQMIEKISERQRVEEADFAERDVVAFVTEGQKHFFNLFRIRHGKLLDQVNVVLKGEDEPSEILRAFLVQYYSSALEIPAEILLPLELEDASLEKFLTQKKGGKVQLLVPQRGQKSKILQMAEKNAESFARQERAVFETGNPLKELKEILKLKREPKRIEGYDISHLSGTATVGSLVVFENLEAKKSDYRNFRIKTLEEREINDYASLAEVLSRRMNYLVPQVAGVTVRKALKKDFVELRKIRAQVFGIDQDFMNQTGFFILEKKKEIIGHVRIYAKKSTGVWVMSNLWVDEKYRGDGLGGFLVRYALSKTKASKVYLDCVRKLLGFYENLGFAELKKIPEKIFEKRCESCEISGKKVEDFIFMVWNRAQNSVDKSFASVPDLVLLDGGKGQLSTVLKNVQFPAKTVVIGLAKENEEIFIFGKPKPIQLPNHSPARLLLQRVRDEAHRFANEHRKEILSNQLAKTRTNKLK